MICKGVAVQDLLSLRKTVEKSVTDSGYVYVTQWFRCRTSNISLKENKPDGVDLSSNGLDYCVRNNEGNILRFSTDCTAVHGFQVAFLNLILEVVWRFPPRY